MSTSSGSRVRRLGTMAMSSSRYARRAVLPIPISTSAIPAHHLALPNQAKPEVYRGHPIGRGTGLGQRVDERPQPLDVALLGGPGADAGPDDVAVPEPGVGQVDPAVGV